MQLHEVKPKNPGRKKRRVGRGGKRGTYSGRGMKGQRSRAGARVRPELRDIVKKIPKLRGVKNKRGKVQVAAIINVEDLDSKFENGQDVNPGVLLEKHMIRRFGGRFPKVKLLGNGTITKKLMVSHVFVSKQAKEKIEKAGGKVEPWEKRNAKESQKKKS